MALRATEDPVPLLPTTVVWENMCLEMDDWFSISRTQPEFNFREEGEIAKAMLIRCHDSPSLPLLFLPTHKMSRSHKQRQYWLGYFPRVRSRTTAHASPLPAASPAVNRAIPGTNDGPTFVHIARTNSDQMDPRLPRIPGTFVQADQSLVSGRSCKIRAEMKEVFPPPEDRQCWKHTVEDRGGKGCRKTDCSCRMSMRLHLKNTLDGDESSDGNTLDRTEDESPLIAAISFTTTLSVPNFPFQQNLQGLYRELWSRFVTGRRDRFLQIQTRLPDLMCFLSGES
ncbi:hypothetical protein Bbelb_274300 [Branchiostoma belcheri]|nr:hypothetical protein Bbelb_274300 [Branchiostoma belcheri]